jgi:nitrogen fixation protein NifU and related proteins
MAEPYNDIVIDHFSNPRNMGVIKDADAVGEVGNPASGDMTKLYLKIENDRIIDARFKTFGCAAAIASSSITTEMIKGKTLDEALLITNQQVSDALGGLPPAKQHCSVLAEDALRVAIQEYRKKREASISQGLR